MSNTVSTRRDALRQIALALTAAGAGVEMDAQSAEHVHSAALADRKNGKYTPKVFNEHEWATVRRLAELIIPADERTGSAADAGAVEFIDLLCSQNRTLADIYAGGIRWMDAEMRNRSNKEFTDCSEAEQKALLDALVAGEKLMRESAAEESLYARAPQYRQFSTYTFKKNTDLAPGVKFFDWVRKMSVDAFYASPLGVKDLNYIGNQALSKYEVPAEAMDYAMKRSPFGNA